VGLARSSRVNVSTPSQFMMKLEKSIRVSRSSLNEERASVCLQVRLSMIERFLEQLAQICSNHDPVLVVSLVGKTIQDAE
nr:hypothetical protein [Tanacetum cinerariifolium]